MDTSNDIGMERLNQSGHMDIPVEDIPLPAEPSNSVDIHHQAQMLVEQAMSQHEVTASSGNLSMPEVTSSRVQTHQNDLGGMFTNADSATFSTNTYPDTTSSSMSFTHSSNDFVTNISHVQIPSMSCPVTVSETISVFENEIPHNVFITSECESLNVGENVLDSGITMENAVPSDTYPDQPTSELQQVIDEQMFTVPVSEQSVTEVISTSTDFTSEHVSSSENFTGVESASDNFPNSVQYSTAADSTTSNTIEPASVSMEVPQYTENLLTTTLEEADAAQIDSNENGPEQDVVEEAPVTTAEVKEDEPTPLEENAFDVVEAAQEVPNVDEGVTDISEEVTNLSEELPNVDEGITDISEEVPNLSEEIPNVSEEVSNISEEVPNLSEEIPNLSEEVSNISEEVPNISEEVPNMSEEVQVNEVQLNEEVPLSEDQVQNEVAEVEQSKVIEESLNGEDNRNNNLKDNVEQADGNQEVEVAKEELENQVENNLEVEEEPQSTSPQQVISEAIESTSESLNNTNTSELEDSSTQDTQPEFIAHENVAMECVEIGNTEDIYFQGENIDDSTQVIIVENVDNVLLVNTANSNSDDQIEVELKKIDGLHEEENSNYDKPDSPDSKNASKLNMEIPSHVLGRNIVNPSDDAFRNGKLPPKPRLGVKIPYRNLTSQIVSKQEIVEEVMKRQRFKLANKDPAPQNSLFARKLTQRLAQKIAPEDQINSNAKEAVISSSEPAVPPASNKSTIANNKDKIQNNSDLLAILEGDGDDINMGETSTETSVEFDTYKELEKQIALKQLQEMNEPKRLTRKSKSDFQSTLQQRPIPSPVNQQQKEEPPVKTEEKTNLDDNKNKPAKKIEEKAATAQETPKEKASPEPAKPKVKSEKDGKENSHKDSPSTSTSEPKDDIHSVPKFSSKMAIKTYSRKRKQTDEEEAESPPQEVVVVKQETEGVYITKSSRVIKKKVIWDPDEVPVRPATKLVKTVEVKASPKVAEVKASPKAAEVKTPPVKASETKAPPKVVEVKTVKVLRKVSPSQKMQPPPSKPVVVISTRSVVPSQSTKSPTKQIQVKTIKKVIVEKPKRLSEVDRLLMDEGAIKMLYDMKNPDENQNTSKVKNKPLVDIEKAQQELINKSNELKNDLQTNSESKVSPKTLRRKEISPMKTPEKPVTPASITRQKSKDSNRSSLHSPPPSPAMIYPEASRIIRRHSSSSYSSDEDAAPSEKSKSSEVVSERVLRKKHPASTSPDSTPKPKKVKKTEATPSPTEKKRNEEASRKFAKLTRQQNEYKSLMLKYSDNLAQIILTPNKQQKVLLDLDILKELTAVINALNGDSNCHIILISSAGSSFCHGLNYKELVANTNEQRLKLAKGLAEGVRTFLTTIAQCGKILAAGVHGDVEGLGVMMLPLFDIVIASDSSTFSVPYGKLGCAPEGGHLLTLPNLMSSALISELLLSQRKLIATEAQRLGLISRIIWPDKFQEEIVQSSKLVASQSSQFLESVKALRQETALLDIEKRLSAESETLVKHWTCSECQKNFSQYQIGDSNWAKGEKK